MKRFSLVWFLVLLLLGTGVGLAQDGDTSTVDESVHIDLGEGNGSLIIIGNNNTVYVPPLQDGPSANQATVTPDGYTVLLLGPTVVQVPTTGVRYEFKRIVLAILTDGTVRLLLAEQ